MIFYWSKTPNKHLKDHLVSIQLKIKVHSNLCMVQCLLLMMVSFSRPSSKNSSFVFIIMIICGMWWLPVDTVWIGALTISTLYMLKLTRNDAAGNSPCMCYCSSMYAIKWPKHYSLYCLLLRSALFFFSWVQQQQLHELYMSACLTPSLFSSLMHNL